MHLSQSGSRSDKRKARGRGLPPSSGVVCLTRAKLFGFCPAVLQWHFVAFGRRVLFVCTCATVPWEWLHKVLCASRVSIPRPSNLLSERDLLCDKCIGAKAECMPLLVQDLRYLQGDHQSPRLGKPETYI